VIGLQYDDGRQIWKDGHRVSFPAGRATRVFYSDGTHWWDTTGDLWPAGSYHVVNPLTEWLEDPSVMRV
jgi:hypothetical protein